MKFNRWPKRDPIKNYFPVPNEIYYLGLEAGEIAIYGYLLSIEDRKTYQCWPSYKTIGKAVRMSPNTVRKYVTALEEKDLISTEATLIRRKDGRPMNGSLLYTIRPIQGAVEMFYVRQLRKVEEDAEKQRIAERLEKLPHRSPCEPLCAPLTEESSPAPSRAKQATLSRFWLLFREQQVSRRSPSKWFRRMSGRQREKQDKGLEPPAAPAQPQTPAVRAFHGNPDRGQKQRKKRRLRSKSTERPKQQDFKRGQPRKGEQI